MGADYVGLGPYKFTTTKENLSPILGIAGYKKIFASLNKSALNIPIVAIGGIELKDVKKLLKTGVMGVAVSSSILNADDIGAVVKKFLAKFNE
jgi:thiamine-phosphate pyrophosphorylase